MTGTLEWNSPDINEILTRKAATVSEEEGRRREWENFLSVADVNKLVLKAKDLFETIHNKTGGVFRFEPAFSIADSGPYRYVREGRTSDKSFFPIGWGVIGADGINELLYQSSQVETEIWRRVSDRKQKITDRVALLNRYFLPYEQVNETFSIYGLQRDFGTINSMPRHIESAFNHMVTEIPFKVEGFNYPHPLLDDVRW